MVIKNGNQKHMFFKRHFCYGNILVFVLFFNILALLIYCEDSSSFCFFLICKYTVFLLLVFHKSKHNIQEVFERFSPL